MGNILSSIIRTLVPLIVGTVTTFLVSRGVVDAETAAETAAQLTAFLTVVVTGVYYTAARFLEAKIDGRFGWLLGLAKQPGYAAGDVPPAREAPGVNTD